MMYCPTGTGYLAAAAVKPGEDLLMQTVRVSEAAAAAHHVAWVTVLGARAGGATYGGCPTFQCIGVPHAQVVAEFV
jgi:hypothetical protein